MIHIADTYTWQTTERQSYLHISRPQGGPSGQGTEVDVIPLVWGDSRVQTSGLPTPTLLHAVAARGDTPTKSPIGSTGHRSSCGELNGSQVRDGHTGNYHSGRARSGGGPCAVDGCGRGWESRAVGWWTVCGGWVWWSPISSTVAP